MDLAPELPIRRLNSLDAHCFHRLRLRSLQDEPAAYSTVVGDEGLNNGEQVASRLTRDVVLGAMSANRLVGIVGLQRLEGARFLHRAVVWGLYVVPEMRRRGVARRLMLTLEREAPPGVVIMELEVVETNATARSLYGALNYKAYGIYQDALMLDAHYLNQILMKKRLAGPE